MIMDPIKIFGINEDENEYDIDDSIEVGDYVICSYDSINSYDYSIEEQNFISNNIGRIVEVRPFFSYPYRITYSDGIPDNINNGLYTNDSFIVLKKNNIKYCSKDKEELEFILSTNKFSL